MKNIISTFLIFCCGALCIAQDKTKLEFVGTLTTDEQQVISYKVVLDQNDDNTVVGYSITDFYGVNRTKTIVEGTIDEKKRTLSFKEIKNVHTKADADISSFCFVTVSKLKIRVVHGKNVMTGKFKGTFPSGETCVNGRIFLVSSSLLKNLRDVMDTVNVSTDTLTSEKGEEAVVLNESQSSVEDLKDSVVKSDDRILIDNWDDNVTLEVWDGDIEDKDRINVFLNGKLLKGNIILTHKKEIIPLPSGDDKYEIEIVAFTEGSAGANSVNFKLSNASNITKYVSELKRGESFTLYFNRNSTE